MAEKLIAALGLLACFLAWAGMALGPARRQALRQWPRRVWQLLRARRGAQREAQDAIERARRRAAVDRDGNVYRPRDFSQRPDGRDKLH
jgi:hypothetical protein